MSCSKPVDMRTLCVDKTKDELNNRGITVLSIDTVITSKPINSKDSVICVLCKTNREYYVTESFTYKDSIKQFRLLASGDKEHCMYYAKYGTYGKK